MVVGFEARNFLGKQITEKDILNSYFLKIGGIYYRYEVINANYQYQPGNIYKVVGNQGNKIQIKNIKG